MINDLLFLFWDTPLKLWGGLVFGGVGALMGHLLWFVSQDQLERLAAQREKLRDQIETSKQQLAERNRMKRDSTWKGSGGGLFSGWRDLLFGNKDDETRAEAGGNGAGGEPEPELVPGPAVERPGETELEPVPFLAAGEPPREDDLTLLDGVDQAAADRLRAAGVTTFEQLAELEQMTPEERLRFSESFGLPPIPLDRWRQVWADALRRREAFTSFAGPVPPADEEPLDDEFSGPGPAGGAEPAPLAYVRPAGADDLTRIRGIDSQMEATLNRAGVLTYEQIAGWSAADVREVSDRLDLADRVIMQRWTAQAAALARDKAASSQAVEAPAIDDAARLGPLQELQRVLYAGEAGTQVDSSLGIIYVQRPELTDELQRIAGIDPTIEAHLNALGIYRFKQIAGWTGDQVARVAGRLGVSPERIEAQRWVEEARRLHAETYPVETGWPEPEPGLQAIEERLHRDYAGEPVRADPVLGVVYHGRPLIVDDLQRIRGVGPVIARQLNQAGIFRFKQIAGWAQSHVRGIASLLNCFPDRIYRDRWIPQARELVRQTAAVFDLRPWDSPPDETPDAQVGLRPAEEVVVVAEPVDHFRLLQTRFAGETGAWVDPRLGILYRNRPPFVDDLTRIQRVDAPLQSRLQSLGIHRFKQIAGWSDANATEIAIRLGIEKRRIRDEDWLGQAEALHAAIYRLDNGWGDKARPTVEEYEARVREQFPGEPVMADEEFGIVYTAQPSRVDDLALLEGIDAGLAGRLNASGIYRFRQIANWSAANIAAFAYRLGFPADAAYYGNWVGQARRRLADEPAATPAEPELTGAARLARDTGAGYNEEFGYLYTERPVRVDDLRAIRGVDGRLAALLNHQGIYRFWQIEHWTDAQRDVFAERLGLGQAIVEQRWREQCRRLALLSEAREAPACPAPEDVDQFAALQAEFAGEPGVRVDARLGIVYDQPPPVTDPLTMIQGLDPRHEQVLHSLGICRFKQLANWKDENVGVVAGRLGLSKDALERGKWIAQAIDRERTLYAASPRWAVDRPPLAEYERLITELFAGENVRADEELGVIFTGTPSRVDDLGRIHGIDPEMERRLHAAGVFSFRQLAGWSAANVDAFARLLRIPRDRIYVERWIGQALGIRASEPPAPVQPAPAQVKPAAEVDFFAIFQREFAGESGLRVDRLLGIVYDQPPGESDELTRIQGLEDRHQAALNRLGIFRFRQIAHWPPATVHEIARRLQLDPEHLEKAGWPAQAARLHAELYRASPAWSAPRPSVADYEARIASDFPGEPVFADEELGILYRGQPALADALQRIPGVTPELERQLHAAGVYRFRQISLWSEAAVNGFERFLGCPRGRVYRQRWIPQAANLAQEHAFQAPPPPEPAEAEPPESVRLAGQVAILERMFAGEPGVRVDRRYGIVYGEAPEVVDDLSLLRGVGPQLQSLLNEIGIYRFKQIAYWSDDNVDHVARFAGAEPVRIRQENWRGQAANLHNEIYSASPMWTVNRPALADYQREIDEDFAGEPVRPDEDLGIIYVSRPTRCDDLTRIPGMTHDLARRLNASGVYRFQQISRWAEANVEAFARWLGCSTDRIYRDRWIPQSAMLAATEPPAAQSAEPEPDGPFAVYAGDPGLRWDSELGYVYREKPSAIDNLQRIRGVDAPLQERLTGCGIHRFWQIARWSPDQARAFAARLQRGNLVEREEWVRQAGILATLALADEVERYQAPARVDQFEAIEREFAGEPGVRADPAFGIVYGERPGLIDDLTRIEGLTAPLCDRLQRQGVYRFKQVANWSDANVQSFAGLLGLPPEQIERHKWVPRARRLHLETYPPAQAWTVDQPTPEEYEQRVRERFPHERVKADPDSGIIYVGRPSHIDDLTDVDGIDAAMARRLHATGVYCFRQLENWAGCNVRTLAGQLEISPERIYRERWIQQAADLACQFPKRQPAAPEQRPAAVTAPAVLEDEPGLRRDERFGLVFRQRPAKIDHLRSIKGVGPKLERRLNELGVYRFRQMAHWTERQVREFADRLHLWGRIDRERWVEQARELAELTEAEALDVFVAPEKVEHMNVLDAEFAHEPSVRVDPYLGIVFDEPPTVVDDLTQIDGIGRRLEEELNHLGVFRYNQIGAWSALNVVHFARHLFCDQERIERDKWIPQARRLYRETYSASWAWGVSHPSLAEYQARIEEEFGGEAVRADEALGIVYTGWPSHVDDLTRIQGLTRELERSMNRLGIYSFEQIGNWAEGNVEQMAARLGIAPQKIYRDRWIAQASDLAAQAALAPQSPAAAPDARLLAVLSAEPGIEVDDQFGPVYGEEPRQTDRLSDIRGIGRRLERELNQLGIYRHRQIACWAGRTAKAVADRLRLDDRIERDQWVLQARELTALAEYEAGRLFVAPATVDQDNVLEAEFAGEPAVRIDARLGIVYETPPEVKDDLTLISGIGPKLEEELNELGVYRFKQIASWSDGNVGEFAQRLFCFKDRIERDKWVPQARRLHRNTYRASPEWGIPRPSVADYEECIALEFPDSGLDADREYGLVYPDEPACADPLTRIQGINPRLEEDLRHAGVHTFRQIAFWSEANVQAFASRLRVPCDRIYRDRWIPQACALDDEARRSGAAEPTPPKNGGPVASEPRSPARPPRKASPGPGPDEARQERPDPGSPGRSFRERVERERETRERAEREERERETRERAEREEREREARERAEREEREREARERAEREERERQARERAQEDARRRADELQRQREERARAEEERRAREERQRLYQERLEREAAERAEQIRRERMERDAEARTARAPSGARERHEDGPVAQPGLEQDDRLGGLYLTRPERTDDLTLIRGIGPATERQLQEQGVYRFHQIASWTRRNVEEFSRLLDLRDRINRENWVEQAWELARLAEEEQADAYLAPPEVDSASVMVRDFAGEWGVGVDENLGILYEERPSVVDDLKLIRGLSPKLERELNSYGVYRYKQIAHWSDHHVAEFAKRLGCAKERIESDKWIPQAKRLHREWYSAGTEWGAYRPGIADYRAKIEEEFPGEDVAADADYGIVYQAPPPLVDHLTQVRGIDREAEQVLNGAGVHRFKQIANWSEANVSAFAELLGCSPERIYRDRWIQQARGLSATAEDANQDDVVVFVDQERFLETHFAGEDVVLDDDLGILFQSPPEENDDFKRIRGIGRKIEQSLNGYGVYQYRQMALWTRENAEEFASRLNAFKDRIFRDNWMKQARLLYEEKYGTPLQIT